jgi:hypothetical protein
MAVAVKPSNSLINIRSSIKSVRSSFSGLKKKTGNLNNILLKKTKVKRESIARNYILSQRREEAERRKNREDLIEASSIGGVIKRQAKAVASSTKGFLGRIMDFLGTLLVGWLLYNLPSIITMAQELIARMQRLSTIVTEFFSKTTSIFRGFGNLLGAIGSNILTFDFTDSHHRVKNAMSDLGSTFDDMQSQFDEGFKLLTTSLGEGVASGKNAAPFGTEYPNESMQEPSGPSGEGGGSPDFWTLAAVSALEDGDPQGRADVAQSIYNRAASGVFGTSSIKGVILSGNGRQYEPVGRAVKEFNAIQDREGAIKAVMVANKLSRSKAEKMIDDTVSAITNTTLKKNAAEFVENRTDFLGAGLNPSNSSSTPLRRRNQNDNVFGNYVGPGSYEYGRKTQGQASLPPTSASSQIAPAPAPTSSPGLSFAKVASSLKGMSSAAGPGRGRLACVWAVNQVFKKAGMTPPWGTSDYVPTAESAMIKAGYQRIPIGKQMPGDLYIVAGQAHIGIVLPNGNIISNSTSGAKFSWEAPLSQYQSYYGGPGKFYRMPGGIASLNKNITPAQIASLGTQQRQQVSQQLLQERNGPTIVVIEEDPPPQQQVFAGGGGGGIIPIIINPLNSFITQKLLLDLAYT